MKKIVFILLLFVPGFTYAQQSKSDEIQKEIKGLELENNKLILNQYISEKTDSMSPVPIFRNNDLLMTNFQNSHPDLKKMRDLHDSYVKQRDSIQTNDPEYKKLLKQEKSASTFEERANINVKLRQFNEQLYKENKQFNELSDKVVMMQHKTNLAILKQMLSEYQAKGELVPVNFIAPANLKRYENNFTVKENQNKIEVLHQLYRKTFENEYSQKDGKKDSIK